MKIERRRKNCLFVCFCYIIISSHHRGAAFIVREKYGADINPERLTTYVRGSDEDDSDSESDTEDEYGEELTPEVDALIMRTIAAIRQKDASVYQKDKNFFDGIRTQ